MRVAYRPCRERFANTDDGFPDQDEGSDLPKQLGRFCTATSQGASVKELPTQHTGRTRSFHRHVSIIAFASLLAPTSL